MSPLYQRRTKLKIKSEGYFPFVITAESAVSAQGNKYLKIGIGHSHKTHSGEYETKWFNVIDKKDLLVLSEALKTMFNRVVIEDAKERKATQAAPAPARQIDDEVPF